MENKISLRKQLILGFTLIALLITIVGSAVSFYFSSNLVRELTMNDLKNRISAAEASIQISNDENKESQNKLMDSWMPEIEKNLTVSQKETHAVNITNQVTQEKIKTDIPRWYYKGQALEDNQEIATKISQDTGRAISFMMLLPEGLMRVATSVKKADGTRTNGTFVPPDSPVYAAIKKGQRYTGRAKVVGSWYVTTYHPIVQEGKVIGAFFIGLPDTASEKLAAYLKKQKLLETGYFYILDKDANFVLHPSKQGQNVLAQTDLDGNPIFKQILEKKDGIIQYRWLNADTKSPQDKLAVFRYFPELDWYVAASVNLAEVEAPVKSLAWFLGFLTIGSALGMMLCAWIFGTKITKKLNSISEALKASAEEVQGSISQLVSAGNDLSQSSSGSAASLEETVASLEEVSSMVKTNADNAKVAATLSADASIYAEKGEQEIKALFASIKEMAHSSKKIQEITSVIDDIAFQTNLLALNAAVEAARAGEQGKGFAVVADAVRSLAQRSANSAKEISALIQTTTHQMEEGTAIADRSSESLNKIVEAIRKVSGINNEIAQASSEQATGIQEINKAMNQLDTSSQTNAASAEQIAATSDDIRTQNNQVEAKVLELQKYMNGKKAA